MSLNLGELLLRSPPPMDNLSCEFLTSSIASNLAASCYFALEFNFSNCFLADFSFFTSSSVNGSAIDTFIFGFCSLLSFSSLAYLILGSGECFSGVSFKALVNALGRVDEYLTPLFFMSDLLVRGGFLAVV